MTGRFDCLDTCFLGKRYLEESGTNESNDLMRKAEMGDLSIVFSAWNIGEVGVVFDKYDGKNIINGRESMVNFLSDIQRLAKQGSLEIFPVDEEIITDSIKYVFEQHIYIADAVQIATYFRSGAKTFWTSDKLLAETAKRMNIKTFLIL